MLHGRVELLGVAHLLQAVLDGSEDLGECQLDDAVELVGVALDHGVDDGIASEKLEKRGTSDMKLQMRSLPRRQLTRRTGT